jgi:hypothetical protein
MEKGDKCKVTFTAEEEPEVLVFIESEKGFYVFRNSQGAKVVARENSLVKIETI